MKITRTDIADGIFFIAIIGFIGFLAWRVYALPESSPSTQTLAATSTKPMKQSPRVVAGAKTDAKPQADAAPRPQTTHSSAAPTTTATQTPTHGSQPAPEVSEPEAPTEKQHKITASDCSEEGQPITAWVDVDKATTFSEMPGTTTVGTLALDTQVDGLCFKENGATLWVKFGDVYLNAADLTLEQPA